MFFNCPKLQTSRIFFGLQWILFACIYNTYVWNISSVIGKHPVYFWSKVRGNPKLRIKSDNFQAPQENEFYLSVYAWKTISSVIWKDPVYFWSKVEEIWFNWVTPFLVGNFCWATSSFLRLKGPWWLRCVFFHLSSLSLSSLMLFMALFPLTR